MGKNIFHERSADNQAKSWRKHGNPHHMTSSDALELVVVSDLSSLNIYMITSGAGLFLITYITNTNSIHA